MIVVNRTSCLIGEYAELLQTSRVLGPWGRPDHPTVPLVALHRRSVAGRDR